MNIILINPPLRTNDPPLYYPIGICYVASYLRENGYKVKVLDINGHRWSKAEFKDVFERESPDAIGIGGLTTAFNHVDWLSSYVKSIMPEIPIIAGNTVASTIPDILLQHTDVDILVMGEGEYTTLELMDRLESSSSLEGLNGIWYKENGNIISNPNREPIPDLDSIPFPAWDLIPMEIYLENSVKKVGHRTTEFSSIRGCPYNCSFCCKTFIGYKVRSRSPENIIEEIKLLVKNYQIDGFTPHDDLFTYDKNRIMKFCDLLIEEGLDNLKWRSSARVNLITKELAQKMKSAGCITLAFGFESSSQKVLDYYNKKCTVEQQQKSIDICREVGIECHKTYIIGARNEDEESVRETVEFCEKNDYQYKPSFYLMPIPGTKIYDECKERGLITDELEYIKKMAKVGDANNFFINITENFTDEELINICNKYRDQPTSLNLKLNTIKERLRECGVKNTLKEFAKGYTKKHFGDSSSGGEYYVNEWL